MSAAAPPHNGSLPPFALRFLRGVKRTSALTFQSLMERLGFVVARRDDYYSPLPSRLRLAATRARWQQPSRMHGVHYDLNQMRAVLSAAIHLYATEFAALTPYDLACQQGFGPGYTRIDAMVLYVRIRSLKPARYLEVGSGLSTWYAAQAARANAAEGFPMQITCIEPNPYPALFTIPEIDVRRREVQDTAAEEFATLAANDVLFIDSSHIVRIDGDVPFLFLEVLPTLRPGVVIHVHDIPFPYNSPYPAAHWIDQQTWPMWWNEAMLVQALLSGSSQFTIELSTPLLRHHDEASLAALIPGYRTVAQDPNTFSSLWLRKLT